MTQRSALSPFSLACEYVKNVVESGNERKEGGSVCKDNDQEEEDKGVAG